MRIPDLRNTRPVSRTITRQTVDYSIPISVVSMLLPVVLLISSCQPGGQPVPRYLERLVEEVRSTHALDSRLQLFQIELSRVGKKITISGEVTAYALREVLLDSLRSAAGDFDILDSILVLPTKGLQPKIYGIVSISVANMRGKPAFSAELVNQILLGTVLELYKEERGFYYARNWDQYLGWVSGASIVRVDSTIAAEWQRAPRVIFKANYGLVRDRANSNGTAIVDLVPGAVLKKVQQTGNWVEVETPDGRVGYVDQTLVMDEAGFHRTAASRDRIAAVAESYLGIPYLWGGTSTKGFDCSGFVQAVFRMNNISLPRDANQMVLGGVPVDPGDQYENVLTGDLLFFGSTPERITHVAIYLNDQQFIQACGAEYGSVHINSLDPEHALYSEYRQKTLRTIKRIQSD